MILAEATNEFAGQWIFLGMAVLGTIGVALAILAYFATRRDVDTLSDNITTLTSNISRLNEIGEARISSIHDRLNPLETEIGRLQGASDSFEKSFEKFTRMIEATARANNDTIGAFTRSLDTFANIIDRSLRERAK